MSAHRIDADRFAIISDIHLGRQGSAHACKVADATLVAIIARLQSRYGKVIVNGDLFDLDRSTWPLRRGAELRRLWAAHHRVAHQLKGADTWWIEGNHDPFLGARGFGHEAIEVHTSRGVVRVEHGHRFDVWIKQQRTFTHLVTWTSGHVAQHAPVLFRAMRRVERLLVNPGRADVTPIERHAAAWLSDEPGLAGLVVGHTHQSYIRTTGSGQWLMGSGQGMTAPIRYAACDAARGELHVGTASADGLVVDERRAWHPRAVG